MLFNDVIFGPVHSRRLGLSLGINVLPSDIKLCTFNCIYCECGWTDMCKASKEQYHPRTLIAENLETRLAEMKDRGTSPDAITFAGNGEPTMHPEFPDVLDDTLGLRSKYFPGTRVVVLSNSTTLNDPAIVDSLMRADCLMKLDAGSEKTFRAINNPGIEISLSEIVNGLKKFKGKLTVQSMFVRGTAGDVVIDNTTEDEISQWISYLREIKPRLVMIYSIDRPPPMKSLVKISPAELSQIASKIRDEGFHAEVY